MSQGVVLEYTGGTFSCKGAQISAFVNSPGRERAANVSFICDMAAGARRARASLASR